MVNDQNRLPITLVLPGCHWGRLLRLMSLIPLWYCWVSGVIAQQDIPPEVQQALYPNGIRHSFNDSLLDDESNLRVPPAVNERRGSSPPRQLTPTQALGTEDDQANRVLPASYQPVMNYSPSLDRNPAADRLTTRPPDEDELLSPLPARVFDPSASDGRLPPRIPSRIPLNENRSAAERDDDRDDDLDHRISDRYNDRYDDQYDGRYDGRGRSGTQSDSDSLSPQPTLAELLRESNQKIQRRQSRSTDFSQESTIDPTLDQGSSSERDGWDASNWLALPSSSSDRTEPLVDTMQRMAISLVLVLFLGVSFIVIAKRWLTGTGQVIASRPISTNSRSSNKATPTIDPDVSDRDHTIRVLNRLKLDDQSHLFLIEVSGQTVLVASDKEGVKSIVPIIPSFETSLNRWEDSTDFSTPEEPDEEGVQLAIESLEQERNATARASNRAGAYQPYTSTPDRAPTERNRAASGRTNPGTSATTAGRTQPQGNRTKNPNKEQALEDEMRRKLAELLGGEAFQDVFLQQANASRR